jgi:hypothetical protein
MAENQRRAHEEIDPDDMTAIALKGISCRLRRKTNRPFDRQSVARSAGFLRWS